MQVLVRFRGLGDLYMRQAKGSGRLSRGPQALQRLQRLLLQKLQRLRRAARALGPNLGLANGRSHAVAVPCLKCLPMHGRGPRVRPHRHGERLPVLLGPSGLALLRRMRRHLRPLTRRPNRVVGAWIPAPRLLLVALREATGPQRRNSALRMPRRLRRRTALRMPVHVSSLPRTAATATHR